MNEQSTEDEFGNSGVKTLIKENTQIQENKY